MSEYSDFSKQLAYDAGDIMRQHFLTNLSVRSKSDESPVTIADLAINQLVIDQIAKYYPDHSVRGEEDSNQKSGDEHVWVCDPIDGTNYYSIGVAIGMFSLALVKNGQSVVAVAYEPITDKLYSAEKGKGSFLNGHPIKVSSQQIAPNIRIDVCDIKNHEVANVRPFGNELYERGVKVTGLRSSVMVGVLVADGSWAAAITPTKHPHDIAAVKLIIEEAGGRVTNVWGQDQRYDQPIQGALMSNGLIHDELVEIVRQTT